MADYTNAELLNEVAKIFRARITPTREGGVLNTRDEYAQLLELASITFLFDGNAIFHLGRQAANVLNSTARQEIALIEDILVSLDDLDQIGRPVVDTAILSNAKTAVLSLDAASSISGRPEAVQFDRQMDSFAEHFRSNVISRKTKALARPRDDARNLIKTNLSRLNTLHSRLLTRVFALRDLLEGFVGLDIPSKASASALKSISNRLDQTVVEIEEYSSSDNVVASRRWLLRTLANKVAVQVVADFSDPRDLKYRTPIRPIPPTLAHLGRVTGEGEPASVLTGEGPWAHPLDLEDLVFRLDDETDITVPLAGLVGASIQGTNSETFEVTADAKRLIVVVDPIWHQTEASAGGTHNDSQVDLSNIRLGYKHLGTPLYFLDGHGWPPEVWPLPPIEDREKNQRPRVVTGLTFVQTAANATYDSATNIVEVVTGGVFVEGDVGGYFEDDAGSYWEIIEFIDGKNIRIAVPAGISPPEFPGVGSYQWAAHRTFAGPNRVFFTPALIAGETPQDGGLVAVGPTTKYVDLTEDVARTAAEVIADASVVSGVVSLHYHAQVQGAAGDPTRISVSPRSTGDPYLKVTDSHLVPDPTAAAEPTLLEDSVHEVLGLGVHEALDPQFEVNDFLSAKELAGAINGAGGGALLADVVATEVLSGRTAQTVGGTTKVEDPAVPDWVTAGVKVRDQIVVETGPYARTYQVVAVTSSQLTLKTRAGVVFTSKVQNIAYSIERNQVKVSTTAAVRGTSIQVTAGPTQLGFSGEIQHATIPGFEALNKSRELLEFRRASVGDFLKLDGSSDEYEITGKETTKLVVDPGLPSNTESKGFQLKSGASRAYTAMQARLETFTWSRNLLKKYGFDENLDAVDQALTSALLYGGNFAASRNQARAVLTTLLSILTDSPPRAVEYSASVPVAADNLRGILAGYSVPVAPSMDSFVVGLRERKYDRAADLLTSGMVADFYGTNEETGSYSGAILSAGRAVVGDLPNTPTTLEGVSREKSFAYALDVDADAEEDFSDGDFEYEIDP